MTNTRYGHTNVSGGDQDQPERKDEGWQRRQGGPQSRGPGPRDDEGKGKRQAQRNPPPGTNTQGELAGIGSAAERSEARLDEDFEPAVAESATGARDRDRRDAGTDQPPRMGGPLGPDPERPHLPEGAQNADTRGSGAGGFDRGVDASRLGTVHQGVREEDPRAGEPG